MHLEAHKTRLTALKTPEGARPFMSHDLIFALVFLVMIAAPALVTTTNDRDERDPL